MGKILRAIFLSSIVPLGVVIMFRTLFALGNMLNDTTSYISLIMGLVFCVAAGYILIKKMWFGRM